MTRAAATIGALASWLALGCAADGDWLDSRALGIRVCADGPVVEGIDVSKWQADIDWDAVAADGVQYAFIRTNHGLTDLDEKYAFNWAEARRVGILRGTYQYFLPSEDAVEQAQLLLDRMGPLEADDLPPVLDVEEADGQTPEVIVAKIHAWMDHVEAALGVKPIIYTAKYFWQDGVGMPDDFLDHPLWVANYGVECPLIADPWLRWDFWQYTSTGSVAGISGNVDRDHFNGDRDALLAFIDATRIPPEGDADAGPGGDADAGTTPAADAGPDVDAAAGESEPGGESVFGCRAAPGRNAASSSASPWLLGLALLLATSRARRRRYR